VHPHHDHHQHVNHHLRHQAPTNGAVVATVVAPAPGTTRALAPTRSSVSFYGPDLDHQVRPLPE
jgi:hypothetical protein